MVARKNEALTFNLAHFNTHHSVNGIRQRHASDVIRPTHVAWRYNVQRKT